MGSLPETRPLVTIADNEVPLISVYSLDGAASEQGPDTGAFVFARSGGNGSSLTVFFTYDAASTATKTCIMSKAACISGLRRVNSATKDLPMPT